MKIVCGDIGESINTPGDTLQGEHEHTLSEIEQVLSILTRKASTSGRGGREQDHIDADHYMGALVLLLAQSIGDFAVQQRVQNLVEQYRIACDEWWYS